MRAAYEAADDRRAVAEAFLRACAVAMTSLDVAAAVELLVRGGDFRISVAHPDDGREFFAALDEAFSDHWEHHGRPFEEWWERRSATPNYDPTLWFLVRDGDEIAAVARSEANRNGGGYVGHLGVRRPWRKRGLGLAMLHRVFGECYARGITRIGLGVDAESLTGATRLYERAGMKVKEHFVRYEKSFA